MPTLCTAAAALAVALTAFGAGTASATGWPPLTEGAYLYSGTGGTGIVTNVDLHDFGTCHDLAQPARSLQIVNGSASVVLYSGAGCTGQAWASGSLAQSDLPFAELSYRVVGL
ncbi:hypothetical protein [Streptomyces sp. NRRL F-5727]|uniref:hypothetical protein n=1 Tax=Streptomyces sp. NRRL F-5727 TaxID=1463871 RepID=UPI001F309205|nr:hypothetical protein [Streptomyces sp. NRRL F-5727]